MKKTKEVDFDDLIERKISIALDKAVQTVVQEKIHNYFYNNSLKINAIATFENNKEK